MSFFSSEAEQQVALALSIGNKAGRIFIVAAVELLAGRLELVG